MNLEKNNLPIKVKFIIRLMYTFVLSILIINPINGQTPSITVDQFGWRSDAKKVAVIAIPERGQILDSSFSLGNANTFDVVEANSGNTVFSGPLISWKEGAIDESSGDRAWWADFSSFTTPGTYYIVVNGFHSFTFEINEQVYTPLLIPTSRTYYYWRTGIEIPETYGGIWNTSFIHEQQQNARLIEGGMVTGPETIRDVSGGWRDAGDFNKYVPFTATTLFDLLRTAENSLSQFGDAHNIPESGNGIPDLLDEIKWEIDWLLKMQLEDGSVSNRVGHTCNSFPSIGDPGADNITYYYTPPTTWSTAIATAIFAKAYRLFESVNYPNYPQKLLNSALKGWEYLENQPEVFPSNGFDGTWNSNGSGLDICHGSGAPSPGDTPSMGDRISRAWAAAELYTLTGNPKYLSFFEAIITQPYTQFGVSQAARMAPSIGPMYNLAVWAYLKADPPTSSVKNQLLSSFRNGINTFLVQPYQEGTDPYRAHMRHFLYDWGTNEKRMRHAIMLLEAIELGIAPENNDLYAEIAEEYLHNIHGRNPLAFTYLSKMEEFGAEKPVQSIFNKWFHHDSPFDQNPPPGFLVGGPVQKFINRGYGGGTAWWNAWVNAGGGTWLFPQGWDPNLWTGSDSDFPEEAYEPRQKSYDQLNNDWPVPSWVLNEAGIYYQAAYLRVLSYFSGSVKTTDRRPVAGVYFSEEKTTENQLMTFDLLLSSVSHQEPIQINYTIEVEGQASLSGSLTFEVGENSKEIVIEGLSQGRQEAKVTIMEVTSEAQLSPVHFEAQGEFDFTVLSLDNDPSFLDRAWFNQENQELIVEVAEPTPYHSIYLHDLMGRKWILGQNGIFQPGINRIQTLTQQFPQGLYMLSLINESQTRFTVLKFVH